MKRKRLLSLLVLLLTVATGLWAQDMKSTPLTMEVLSAGTIKVDMGTQTLTTGTGMKYSVNGGTKTEITQTTTIENLTVGDKVQFYGNGTSIKAYGKSTKEIMITGGTASVKVYGNIMSLVDETGYATATTLPDTHTFRKLFYGNTKLTDASHLLLPAEVMTEQCYLIMFRNCYSLTAAPELPATTLAKACYQAMFQNCSSLTSAPELRATTLVNSCYRAIFYGCPKLASVTCLATDISATDCTTNWLGNTGSSMLQTK